MTHVLCAIGLHRVKTSVYYGRFCTRCLRPFPDQALKPGSIRRFSTIGGNELETRWIRNGPETIVLLNGTELQETGVHDHIFDLLCIRERIQSGELEPVLDLIDRRTRGAAL